MYNLLIHFRIQRILMSIVLVAVAIPNLANFQGSNYVAVWCETWTCYSDDTASLSSP